jgi:hypothetical protein
MKILIHAGNIFLLVISIALPIERVYAAASGLKVRMSFAAISGAVAPVWIAKTWVLRKTAWTSIPC